VKAPAREGSFTFLRFGQLLLKRATLSAASRVRMITDLSALASQLFGVLRVQNGPPLLLARFYWGALVGHVS
jgi:hypothetical protein